MSDKLLVFLNELTEEEREEIREAAGRHGVPVCFAETEEEAEKEAAEATMILAGNPGLIAAAKRLRWYCAHSAGVDHFISAWKDAPEGAVLSNSSGAYGVTISEHIVMMLLEILRQREAYREIVSRREWVRQLPVRSILGSCFTFLGTGDIGQETVRKIRGFRPASVVGLNRGGRNPEGLFDRVEKMEKLEEFLPETDVLVMSLPGTEETRHLLNARTLSLLPDNAVIINVGRGNSIDEEALLGELRSGRLYAALDVFEKEPLPKDSPLYDAPNLLITPHISGNMTLPYTVQRITELFLEDFERVMRSEKPQRAVDILLGY